jgi:hypothetical protein
MKVVIGDEGLTQHTLFANELAKKLHPGRFPGMSSKMAAIVGCILGQKWTSPAIEELVVTSDGIVLGRIEGDCGCNEWIGSYSDLRRNWESLLDAAGLTDAEKLQAQVAYENAVTSF